MEKNHRSHPSGVNKSDGGTGVPADKYADDLKRDEELTNKYTDDKNEISDSIHQNNPNRNTDKDHATNAGGYRN